MKPGKILVTGASGFLGCRVVERLLLGEKVSVRAMAHRPGRAARLARLPVEIVWADITDSESTSAALQDCDVVIHCAYGTGGIDHEANRRVTVGGTRVLAEASLRQGVKRFIQVSTIAVYSYSPPKHLDENTPLVKSGVPYCDDKIEAEKVIWRLIRRRGLPAVVLRMGNIYGPFSAPWTHRPLNHIRDGMVSLVNEGIQPSNVVFVDNAVDAIFHSIREDSATGKAFFITDDETSWAELYGRYASWLGGVPLHSISGDELAERMKPTLTSHIRASWTELRKIARMPEAAVIRHQLKNAGLLGSVLDNTWRHTPGVIRNLVNGGKLAGPSSRDSGHNIQSKAQRLPSLELLQAYARLTTFSNERAKRVIGHEPRVDFDKATKVTESWAKWARLI